MIFYRLLVHRRCQSQRLIHSTIALNLCQVFFWFFFFSIFEVKVIVIRILWRRKRLWLKLHHHHHNCHNSMIHHCNNQVFALFFNKNEIHFLIFEFLAPTWADDDEWVLMANAPIEGDIFLSDNNNNNNVASSSSSSSSTLSAPPANVPWTIVSISIPFAFVFFSKINIYIKGTSPIASPNSSPRVFFKLQNICVIDFWNIC